MESKGQLLNGMENRAVLMGEGSKGRVRKRLRGGTGRPLGCCREGVCLVGRGELATLRLQVQGSRERCHGRVSVASQGLTFPSVLENQAAKCPLGWDEPLAAALPVLFPDRCSHSPACTCGLLATHTLTWHLSLAESDSSSMSYWLEPPGFSA